MKQLSTKRAKAIASGGLKLNGRSTFKQMSAQEYREQKSEEAIEIRAALYGRPNSGREEKRRAKARAWVQFSMFIRLRDSDADGIAACITCGARKYWRDMDAGHYVTTAKEATKFHENNVHAQCKGCNKWQGGKPVEYEIAIDKKYGVGFAANMRHKSRVPCKRLTRHYDFLFECYRAKVAAIKDNDPQKFNRPDHAH